MPQKTKEQKKLASIHKTRLNSIVLPKKTVTPTYIQENVEVTSHTLSDLKKTIIITIVILALEFLVFYANLKGIVSVTQ